MKKHLFVKLRNFVSRNPLIIFLMHNYYIREEIGILKLPLIENLSF